MTEIFFHGVQQDFKLAILPPLVCALFRLAFILTYRPKKDFRGEIKRWYLCFSYGFWWGMDLNAYVFLLSFVLVTLPSVFLPQVCAVGDALRLTGLMAYLALIYTAFMAKMIFYFHFHDIFNHTIFLGKNADKKNFVDIFFNQNHGAWILLGYAPYIALCALFMNGLLALPTLPAPRFSSEGWLYAFNTALFLGSILMFYWFRYGGTLNHRKKPEWDEVPSYLKEDIFLAKAVMDDLITLKILRKRPRNESLMHTDEESAKIIGAVLPKAKEAMAAGKNPLRQFCRHAEGPRIRRPSHIFLLFGEGYAQAPFDSIYENLHVVDAGKKFRRHPGTIAFDHFLSGGTLSQTSIVSILSGIFDVNMELNENQDFWYGNVPTALASQMKKLGYRTEFWYGGSLSWGSLEHYTAAVGFDKSMDGVKISPKNSPRTWLGIYDHIYLENVARIIRETDDGAPVFHFVYTTSNHGPYNIPVEKYGFDKNSCMPDLPEVIFKDHGSFRRLACWWYADKALNDFAEDMRNLFPDSLFIITGDHSTGVIPFSTGFMERTEPTLRERMLTSFAVSHPMLTKDMFAGNTIGSHMNILPTLMELIAPKDFEYFSLFPSLTTPITRCITPHCWLDCQEIGLYGDNVAQSLAVSAGNIPLENGKVRYLEEKNAYCELTGYIVRHKEYIDEKPLRGN